MKGDQAGPLGLTPLTCLVLPCVCLTRPFLIYSLPAPTCTHTQLAAAGSCLPSKAQLIGQCCEAFSRLLLLCSLSPLFLALWSVAPHLACVHVCLHIVHSCLQPLIKNRASQVAPSGKEPACQCRRCKRLKFDSLVGKMPWRRAWQPTPVFLPGESQG